MSPSDETQTTATATASATVRAQTPRFAFTPDTPEPSHARVTGNVAAVLYCLAKLTYDPEHRIVLDPLAADGLSHILTAAHNDLMDAAEVRPGSAS